MIAAPAHWLAACHLFDHQQSPQLNEAYCEGFFLCRPVLHLGGMQDGQVRQTRLALPALQSADVAARSGTRWAVSLLGHVPLPTSAWLHA